MTKKERELDAKHVEKFLTKMKKNEMIRLTEILPYHGRGIVIDYPRSTRKKILDTFIKNKAIKIFLFSERKKEDMLKLSEKNRKQLFFYSDGSRMQMKYNSKIIMKL